MKFKLITLLFIIITPFINFVYSNNTIDRLILPSVEPGTYSDDIELSFSKVSGITLYYYFKGSMDHNPVPYIFPLSLSAIYGSNHSYSLIVTALDGEEVLQTKELNFTIDKDIPLKPELNIQEGIYNKSLQLNFTKQMDSIYYSFQSSQPDKFKIWQGKPLELEQKENLENVFIKSYSKDKAGNRSSVNISKFTILPLLKKDDSLIVLSPVSGKFLNSQLLYIDTSDYKWVRYTINNTDPTLRGTTYTKPIMFKTIGDYKLKIAAMSINSNNLLTKEIIFSIVDNKNLILNKESGVYKDDINLKFDKKGLLYNISDRKVLKDDPLLPVSLSFMPVPGVLKYRALRMRDPSENLGYRYFYVLDQRIPPSPIISISDNSPISANTDVRIISIPGTEVYYTTDGSTPDRYSNYYNKTFNMKIPENLNSGSLMVKAIAYFNDKSASPVISKLLAFDIKRPDKPVITIVSKKLNQTNFNISNAGNNRIIYNLSYNGSEPEEPDLKSFTGQANMTVSVPHGINQKIRIKAALADRAANISESVSAELMEVDTVPPESPIISMEEGKVSLTAEDKIYYKICNNSVCNDFTLYNTPFKLEQLNTNYSEIIISAYAEDKNGNKSIINVSKKYIIDKRIAAVPIYTGIKDGGLYNTPRSLRFHSSDNINVFYTVSQGVVIPSNPVPGTSKKVVDFIYFDCPVNEIRKYNIKLVASYNGEDSLLSKVQNISFDIDRIAPRVPVITSISDGQVYNDDIEIKVDDRLDDVWILIKDKINEEDLNYTNFEMNGILLKTNYTLEQLENTDKQYQIAALAIDKAGNTSISRNILSFSIDKILPEAPTITVNTLVPGKSIVHMTSPYSIVYEVKEDGTYPGLPNINSVLYSLPLEFQGKNRSKIFISARTVDSAGNLSKECTNKKILFNVRKLNIPLIDIVKLNSNKNSISFPTLIGEKIFIKEGEGDFIEYTSPMVFDLRGKDFTDLFYFASDNYGNRSSVAVSRLENTTIAGDFLTGISNNKVYNSGRVVWKSDKSQNIRYEVAIDNNVPKKVSIFSPELVEPIVFDAAEGETLKVSINVKEFLENSYTNDNKDTNISFIIDKTKPLVPVVKGVENNGYYQDGKLIKLSSNGIVYYELISSNDKLSVPEFKRYNQPLDINTEEGKNVNFTLKTYSEDSAGNRSTVKTIIFSIDKANIYVSVNGKDSNLGSKFRPFRTITRAFEFLEESKRNIINLSYGEFSIDNSFNISNDVTILGAYNPETWSYGMGETVLKISGRYPISKSIFNVQSGKVTIKNTTISNVNLTAPIINMFGGNVFLNKTVLLFESRNAGNLIKVADSGLNLNDCDIINSSLTKANLFDSKNSNILISESRIKSTGNSSSITFFNLDNTKMLISDSIITPFSAQKIRIFNTVDSKIIINDTNINTGFAKINTDVFVLKNSKLNINDSDISSDSSSRILSCFDVSDSNLSIQNSCFILNANSGTSFLRAQNTSFEINGSEIDVGKTNEFIYLLDSKNSIVNFSKNNITIGNSDIIKGFILGSSVSVFRDNSMNFLGGTTVFEAFNFNSPLSIELVSNNILSKNLSWISSENQPAFSIIGGKDSIYFKDNNIFGWSSVLNYNGNIVNTTDGLNKFRAFMENPEGNYSRED